VIIIANGLVASEVDHGSMAYTLSTPTTRGTVVFTKGLYLVGSLALMFFVVMLAGTITIQLRFGYFGGTRYTPDVQAAARVLKMDDSALAADLKLIRNDERATEAGANARDLQKDEYIAYLDAKILENAYQAAAVSLNKNVDDVKNDVNLIKSDTNALAAVAEVLGLKPAAARLFLTQKAAVATYSVQSTAEMEKKMTNAILAAAKVLDTEIETLLSRPAKIKQSPEALAAAATAAGMDESIFTQLINTYIATTEIAADEPGEFSTRAWFDLCLGSFLLMFAFSSISFFASCVFNLTKQSLAIGAGVPLAFILMNLLSEISDSLSILQNFTLTTLFDVSAIISGEGYIYKMVILGVIGIVLYTAGIMVFRKKDLPL
jgi:ABC-2 type transport system permease protein